MNPGGKRATMTTYIIRYQIRRKVCCGWRECDGGVGRGNNGFAWGGLSSNKYNS